MVPQRCCLRQIDAMRQVDGACHAGAIIVDAPSPGSRSLFAPTRFAAVRTMACWRASAVVVRQQSGNGVIMAGTCDEGVAQALKAAIRSRLNRVRTSTGILLQV